MPPVGFEPTILASERPKTHALERAAIGIGLVVGKEYKFGILSFISGNTFL
jgi:hypothetical protein